MSSVSFVAVFLLILTLACRLATANVECWQPEFELLNSQNHGLYAVGERQTYKTTGQIVSPSESGSVALERIVANNTFTVETFHFRNAGLSNPHLVVVALDCWADGVCDTYVSIDGGSNTLFTNATTCFGGHNVGTWNTCIGKVTILSEDYRYWKQYCGNGVTVVVEIGTGANERKAVLLLSRTTKTTYQQTI